jgi:hypothetical protein
MSTSPVKLAAAVRMSVVMVGMAVSVSWSTVGGMAPIRMLHAVPNHWPRQGVAGVVLKPVPRVFQRVPKYDPSLNLPRKIGLPLVGLVALLI